MQFGMDILFLMNQGGMDNLTDVETRYTFDVPILFILFNRPDHARKVLERIRQIQPAQLFVAIDGPRDGVIADIEGVKQCKALLDEIDWPCTVTSLIRDQNLGCRRAVSSAIDWFFKHVETGIILEDDCLPDITFFEFCRVLLRKYADDSKVMHIGGANLYGDLKWGHYSYFFSKTAHIWGWATWRRAWLLYDVDMKDYPVFKKNGGISKVVTYSPSRSYWKSSFDNTYSGVIDTWDYQWLFTIWKNDGVSIIPNQNLISNIGFGEGATHTLENSSFSNLLTVPIEPALMIHPPNVMVNNEAVNYAFAKFYKLPSIFKRKISLIKELLF